MISHVMTWEEHPDKSEVQTDAASKKKFGNHWASSCMSNSRICRCKIEIIFLLLNKKLKHTLY